MPWRCPTHGPIHPDDVHDLTPDSPHGSERHDRCGRTLAFQPETPEEPMTDTTTTEPRQYRTSPVTVTALQWTGDNLDAMTAFAGTYFAPIDPEDRGDDPDCTAAVLSYFGGHGWVPIRTGDWVVRSGAELFRPYARSMFEATFEPAPITRLVPESGTVPADLARELAEALRTSAAAWHRAHVADGANFAECSMASCNLARALLARYDATTGGGR